MLESAFHASRVTHENPEWAKSGHVEIRDALVEANKDFSSLEATVYFYEMKDSHEHAIRETYGVHGTASSNIILVSQHPTAFIPGKLKKCVLHEFNHLARLKHFSFFKNGTFLDWMIMEGLAETYVHEKYPNEATPPWTHPLDEAEMGIWLSRLKELWLQKRDSIEGPDEWFFGSERMKPTGTKGVPKWLGYKLGFMIVQAFRKRHSALKWSELIAVPSESFL